MKTSLDNVAAICVYEYIMNEQTACHEYLNEYPLINKYGYDTEWP